MISCRAARLGFAALVLSCVAAVGCGAPRYGRGIPQSQWMCLPTRHPDRWGGAVRIRWFPPVNLHGCGDVERQVHELRPFRDYLRIDVGAVEDHAEVSYDCRGPLRVFMEA
jgi:hypothetical protein